MVGGLSVLIALAEELDIEHFHAVDAGLRMGVMSDLQLRANKRDRREQSVRDFMQRFHADPRRAERVAHTAAALYAQLKPASDSYGKYLNWSSLLHEIGMVVSHTGYHKHAAYIIANGDMPGFTTGEQRAMSTLILAQKGNLRKVSEALANPDLAKAVLALRLAVMFMHSRMEVHASEIRVRMKKAIELEIRDAWIASHPSVSYWLDKEREQWSEVGVDFQIRKNG
jgi:exopolyphosphatase/guanosine-5'-triphosphate,3'-diphosphate pyrophosphatase